MPQPIARAPKLAFIVGAAGLACFFCSVAFGYTGGPQMIEVLGWDPDSSRVYFHAVYWDESMHSNTIYHFDLRSRQPGEAARDSIVGEDTDPYQADSLEARALASLRSRLRPLEPVLSPAFAPWITWTERDSSTKSNGKLRAFQVTASFPSAVSVEAQTFHSPEVCARAVYRIPGRDEQVWLFAFRGDPDDLAQVEAVRLIPGGSGETHVHLSWTYGQLP